MKSFNSFLIGLLTLSTMVFFVSSCSTFEVDEIVEDNAMISTPDNPTVIHDRYGFESVDQFEAYYQYMDVMYEHDFTAYLELMKQNEGQVNTVFHKLLNDEFYNPEDRYQPFLTLSVIEGLVNEHFEVQIDDVLLTFVTNELILTSKVADTQLQQAIRALSKGEGVFDINRIPEGAFLTTSGSFDQLLGPWSEGGYSFDYEHYDDSRNCTTAYRHTGYPFTQKLNHGMSTRVAAAYSFGKTREEAKIYAYSRSSASASWQPKTMGLSITIWVDRRAPSSCNWSNDDDKDGFKNRSVYSILRSKSGKYAHSTGDVRGQMRADFNVGGSDESLKKTSTIRF